VDTIKDAIYSRLRSSDPGPGYCHFPFSYELEYFKQLYVRAGQNKVHQRSSRVPPRRPEKRGPRRVYAFAALHSRSVPWEVLAKAAPTEPPPAPPAGREPAPEGPGRNQSVRAAEFVCASSEFEKKLKCRRPAAEV
jgi:phage terminase large subunit GpA-like protein